MPELPETETIARDLHGAVVGAQITEVSVQRRDVLRETTILRLSRLLPGRVVTRAWRRAKSIVISLDSDTHLVVTPRFTGALILGEPNAADPYACLRLTLADGRELRYTDVRRLGTVTAMTATALAAWSDALGPEPLDPAFTPEQLAECLRGSSRAVKAVLMDQKRLAGVGNIYANESLWRAGIRPSRRAASLTRMDCATLHRELTGVLRAAIDARGTSFRDYRDAFGQRGNFSPQLQVYGRGGKPCARCGATLLVSDDIDGRSTIWCRGCQS